MPALSPISSDSGLVIARDAALRRRPNQPPIKIVLRAAAGGIPDESPRWWWSWVVSGGGGGRGDPTCPGRTAMELKIQTEVQAPYLDLTCPSCADATVRYWPDY